jgi:uncharacterized protein YjbJ (UPF0337 family)
LEEKVMDNDRVVGSAKQVKGAVKEAVGKAVGDAKLESEGEADKVKGKVQNAIGGLKDTVKDALKGNWALRVELHSRGREGSFVRAYLESAKIGPDLRRPSAR